MRLLLDSHAFLWLWFCEGNPNLSAAARAAIEDAANQSFISHASAWEIAIKVSLNKLQLGVPYADLFPKAVAANGFKMLEPDLRHYEELLSLPMLHRDPFDRLLIAQAKIEQMTFVSRDQTFAAYGVPIVW